MRNLIIVSGGKFGREVFCWASHAIDHGAPLRIKGFLDDRPKVLDGYSYPVGVICSVETYDPAEDDVFVIAAGDPFAKRKYSALLAQKGGAFATVVHPTACIGRNVKLGQGVIVGPFSVITCDIEIGNFVSMCGLSSIGHDARVGDYCQISGHCDITGNAVLEEGVFLGSHAAILPNARVGAWSYVGAGSVVLKRVPPRTKVFGVPAVPIGKVEEPT